MIAAGLWLATALRFAWPAEAEARVELTDVREIGDESRAIVMTMRLRVAPDAATGHVVARLSDPQLVSINGKSAGTPDPTPTLLDTAGMMACITPTMVVDRDGRYLETQELERMTRDIWGVAGLPVPPGAAESFGRLLSDVAAEDWNAWVGAWIGNALAVGESAETERTMSLRGGARRVRLTQRALAPSSPDGRTKLEASAVYASEVVRLSTRGSLIDLAREAKILKGNDPAASERFLEEARYSPLTDTLNVELETATMRPLVAQRARTYAAAHGKLKVEGRETRTHRFTWVADNPPPPVVAE
jgi:hypothetical protein